MRNVEEAKKTEKTDVEEHIKVVKMGGMIAGRQEMTPALKHS